MTEIEITDENFIETHKRMQEQTMDTLIAIARRFKMPEASSEPEYRETLIERIVSRIKSVMVSKYQPTSYTELNKITKLLVDSLIQKPKEQKTSVKKIKSKKEIEKVEVEAEQE